MYTKQEASAIKSLFWTRFGQYMKPIPSSWKEKVNWVNYKTGIKDIYFRMNVDAQKAVISIDITIDDAIIRAIVFEQFTKMKSMLEMSSQNQWIWQEEVFNEFGFPYARIYQEQLNVNVFKQEDWPSIISFLKQRIVALDNFWADAKDGIDMVL